MIDGINQSLFSEVSEVSKVSDVSEKSLLGNVRDFRDVFFSFRAAAAAKKNGEIISNFNFNILYTRVFRSLTDAS